MAVTYKDIGLLTQKSAVAGTEKIPVSATEYITPNQIAGMTPVDSALSGTSTNPVQNKVIKGELDKAVYLGTPVGAAESAGDPILGIQMNGSAVTVANGIADLGTVLTQHQDITGLASESYVDNAIADALGDIETLLAAL